jgi:hypothetical protein
VGKLPPPASLETADFITLLSITQPCSTKLNLRSVLKLYAVCPLPASLETAKFMTLLSIT